MQDYPKILRRGGDEITITCASEESAMAEDGWRGVGDGVAPPPEVDAQEPATFGPPDDGTGEEPTEGPADDATHVKRSRKKK